MSPLAYHEGHDIDAKSLTVNLQQSLIVRLYIHMNVSITFSQPSVDVLFHECVVHAAIHRQFSLRCRYALKDLEATIPLFVAMGKANTNMRMIYLKHETLCICFSF